MKFPLLKESRQRTERLRGMRSSKKKKTQRTKHAWKNIFDSPYLSTYNHDEQHNNL